MWYGEKDRLDKALKIIKQYKGVYVLTPACRKELDEAYATVESVQKNCMHFWEIYESFSQFHRECKYCGLHDRSYDHSRKK